MNAEIGRLFEDTSDLAHRAAWRITRNADDAQDILQSVFAHLLRHPPSPWPENPAAYVHRAAVNASLDLIRRRKRRPESPVEDAADLPGTENEERDAVSRLEGQRLAGKLGDALATLSPLEAEVFSLRFFEEMGNQDIAAMLDKTPNHIGVTLHAARTKLKSALLSPAAARPGTEGAAS